MRRLILLAALAAAPTALQAQWTIQTPATTADLRGIDNVGHGTAWASGTDGTVLRTTDTGKSWQRCTHPPKSEHLDFRGIQAFDANTAIVMSSGKGDLSRLYKTTDGCQTWKLLFINPDKDGFWDALIIPPPVANAAFSTSGILIGDPVDGDFSIFVTPDSGDTWRRWSQDKTSSCKERPIAAEKDEALFAASNQVLIFDRSETTLLFVTGGPSGSRIIYTPMRHGDSPPCDITSRAERLRLGQASASSGAFAASGSSSMDGLPKNLMIVGGDFSKPDQPAQTNLIVQKNGFHIPFTSYLEPPITSQTPPHGYRSAVAYDAPTKTWITVGPNGTDISTDDGRNWHPLNPSPTDTPDADQHWNALSLPFVVGPHGRIGILNSTALKPPTKAP